MTEIWDARLFKITLIKEKINILKIINSYYKVNLKTIF